MASSCNIFIVICTVLSLFLQGVTGAGRMLVPPQRSSLWRDPIQRFNTLAVKNHEDHMLNCGGLWVSRISSTRVEVFRNICEFSILNSIYTDYILVIDLLQHVLK